MTPSDAARLHQIKTSRRFKVEDIPLLTSIFEANLGSPSPHWVDLETCSLDLPDWFDHRLPPDSDAYTQQQLRLWRTISARDRDYRAEVDEKEVSLAGVDAIRFPGFYMNRAENCVPFAADHLLATALMLKHSNVKPGSWALEYGAGFGQTALALARLGVNVDTVDISRQFCEYVKASSEFYGVPLTPFNGLFGDNPRGPQHKYDLIFFYEAFHHALDFRKVAASVSDHLAPRGRIILCGEPIHAEPNAFIPYPWGLRLDAATVVVTRSRGWMELGFTHRHICSVFTSLGFSVQHVPCDMTALGNLYVFERTRAGLPDFATISAHPHTSPTWHGMEPGGRWSKERSELRVEVPAGKKQVLFEVANFLPVAKTLTMENGGKVYSFEFTAGQSRVISIPNTSDSVFVIKTPVHCPQALSGGKLADRRELGLFFKGVDCR